MIMIPHKITIYVLILFLAIASVLCCCFTRTAQAELNYKIQQSQGNEHPCCHDKPKSSNSKQGQECQCDKFREISYIKRFNLSKILESPRRLLEQTVSVSDNIIVSDPAFINRPEAQFTTQVNKSDPPIYLQDSVFRL